MVSCRLFGTHFLPEGYKWDDVAEGSDVELDAQLQQHRDRLEAMDMPEDCEFLAKPSSS